MGRSNNDELEDELEREQAKEAQMMAVQKKRQDAIIQKQVTDRKRAYGSQLLGSVADDEEDDEGLLG